MTARTIAPTASNQRISSAKFLANYALKRILTLRDAGNDGDFADSRILFVTSRKNVCAFTDGFAPLVRVGIKC